MYSINDSFIVSQIETEIIAHASNIIVSNSGKCYVVYYAGDNAEVEAIKGTDICVKILSFKNPSFVDNRKVVLKPGDVVKDFWQSYDYSPYDPCLIEIDEFIRIWMVLTPINGDVRDCCIGFRDYNPKTQELDSSIGLCNISYYKNDQLITLPLSIENLNKFADDIRNTETGYHFVGDYPVFNTVKSIDGVLYTIMFLSVRITNILYLL